MKKMIIAAVLAFSFYNAGAQVSEQDRNFAEEAAVISLTEIKLGELAQTNASSQDIKNLGKHMIEDHTRSYNDIKALAQRKGTIVPSSMGEKGQKEYDKLSKKTGKDFDKAYAHCMVKGHKKAISKFKKEEKNGDDSEFKTWAATTRPVLEQHKEMAKEACKSTKKAK